MSILGEHPQSIPEKSLNYLLGLIKVEGSTMTKLSALTIIHQLMMDDPNNDVKSIFLQNGILEWILLDFDVGFDSEENSVFLEVALNILWSISKLSVCLVQPMISQIIIRRLISMFDETTPFYSFPTKFKTTLKLLCENKLLVGNVSSNLVSVKVKDDIRTATNGKFKNFKRFPEEIQMCSLYDTNDLDNEINITNRLISNNLAWPLKQKDSHDPTSADDTEDAWKDVLVTEVIDGPYFWAHVGIETIENVRRIQSLLLLEHSAGRLNPVSCDKDDLVVVAKDIDGEICFFRAHIMSRKPQEVKVWALDYGFILSIMPDRVYKMPSSLNLPSQIQLCCIKGVQPQPRDPVLVKLAASILCNLTHKTISAGDIIVKLDGYEQLNQFLKMSQDQNINKEVLKLITNLSFCEQQRKKWLETEIIPNLLDKLSDPGNKKIYANILFCLSNLIMKHDEGRAKFYHNQGIDIVLTVIMQSPVNGMVYMACIHLLRAFVHRIGMETRDSRPMAPTKFQKAASPTKNSTNYPLEMNKLITRLEDTDLQMGEIQCSISEDRLGHNTSCDDEEDFKSCDNKLRHRSTNELRELIYGEESCDTSSVPVFIDTSSVPVNACAPSFDKKRFYIKGTTVNVQTDSLHELRPNRTLANISSTVIATHVCGMLNSRKGGHIIFGISKTSKVEGVKASRDDRDEFRIGVDRMMTEKLSPAALHSLFDMEYHPIMVENEFTGELTRTQDLYVIIIQIKPSKGILYTLKTDNTNYIRFGPSTSPLSVQDLRNLVILEEEDQYRSQIMELRNRIKMITITDLK